MTNIKAIYYERPRGRRHDREISIDDDIAAYIAEKEIELSYEDDALGGLILYLKYGETEDGEPMEHIEIIWGCTLQEGVVRGINKLKPFI